LSAEPLVAAVDAGYRISVVLASLFAVLAALAAIALSSNERARDVAMLRTLGLSVREGGLMTLVEQVPWVVFAVLSGVGFGAGLSWLIAPAVELSSFTGVETPVDITITWAPILVVAVAVVAVLVLAVGAYSYRFRRTSLGDVLRVGDQ
jgi:putative ABC transport system permease protein